MRPRYVYFDKKTGNITDILRIRKRGRAKYVTTTDEVVGPIIAGEMSISELVVAYDTEQEDYVILNRDNVIKLRYYGKDLYKIPNRVIEDYDLRIDTFVEGNVIEVSLDPYRMSTMYSTDFRDEVCFEKGTELRLYVKNGAGDKLLQTIVIDAQQLLDNGQMFFELKDADQNDMSFYTNRVLDNYMWRRGIIKFLSPMKDQLKFEVQQADLRQRGEGFNYHLIISKAVGGLKIINNIDNIKLVKIFDDVEFFIVDKYDPSILYDKFVVKPQQFKAKEIFVEVDQPLKGKGILYNNKYISVLLKG